MVLFDSIQADGLLFSRPHQWVNDMCLRIALWRGCLCLALWMLCNIDVFAQNNNNNNNAAGGILIDADGVVSSLVPLKESVAAAKKRQLAFLTSHLSVPLTAQTESRRVSLRQLDAQLAEIAKAGGEVPAELKYLAGLTRIDYLVVDRETRDIALVGPAEGFAPDLQGRMRGVTSGRPVLNLEDLLVAWRTTHSDISSVSCSIDPTPEGLAAFKAYTSQPLAASANFSAGKMFDTMASKLGRQVISVNGVPKDTHFAVVLVEADLRMKRIALGKDPSGVRGVTSHLSLMRLGDAASSRWWFVPLYDPIEANADRTLFHLSGQRLQLLGQDEYTTTQGQRTSAPSNKYGTTKFVQQFTDHIPELAVAHPVFAELQNLFDWMVICTLIRRQQLDESIEWQPQVLGDAPLWPTRTYPVPSGVDSAAMTNRVGRTVLGLVGGVDLNAEMVVSQMSPLPAGSTPTLPVRHETRAWND